MTNKKIIGVTSLAMLVLFTGVKEPGKSYLLQQEWPQPSELPAFLSTDARWADSLMEELSLEERIAQMIMVSAYSNLGESHASGVLRILSRDRVGGVLFFQGDPLNQARLTNRFQEVADIPLLIAMDGENGLGMRLQGVIDYPPAMTLGAITDNMLIWQMGRDMGRQMNRLGIHMNFAPVADINSNPSNPVIGSRSFGEQRENVSDKVIALAKGMQSGGVIAIAKHFPGHGDTGTDSHRTLPVIGHDRHHLDSMELFPFREAVRKGLQGVMVAHLQVPALDSAPGRPTTLSRAVVTDVLKRQLGFRGLVVTDALNMKGVTQSFTRGELEVEAVKAGNDILLMPADAGEAIRAIKRAVRAGEIPEDQIDRSCRKILMAKRWAGLHDRRPVMTESLMADLNRPEYMSHYRKLVENSLTLVRNRDHVLPLKELQKIRLATVTISGSGLENAGPLADRYLEGAHFTLSSSATPGETDGLLSELGRYNTIIVHLLNTSGSASRKYGIGDGTVRLIGQMDRAATVILNLAGSPSALSRMGALEQPDAIILSNNDDPLSRDLVTQGIFGGIRFTGRLSAGAGPVARAGEGVTTGEPVRLGYCEPFDVGLDPDTLLQMEKIIQEAIWNRTMPGCQLLVARKGKVVWHRAYGHHTYRRRQPVRPDDIYDLASVTKITAALPALMQLRDRGRFHEDSLLGAFGAVSGTCNKKELLISDILTHQAGLVPWIPFYYATLEPLDSSESLISSRWSHIHPLKIGPGTFVNRNVQYREGIYSRTYSPEYPVQVAADLYIRDDFRDTIYRQIEETDLGDRVYLYSDLGYYLLQKVVENVTDTLLYPYVWHNFYAPLGAVSMGYLPLNRFPAGRIVPTENDMFYRRQMLRGYVHDMGAAMLGGISGHAGLFGNSGDLAKMMQMYLNGGTYGGQQFIEPATIALYSSCFNCTNGNRRGLGFDRPVNDEPDAGPACNSASPLSFGHTGFTGTMAWADPAYDLLFVFLSNRVHPNQGNTRLIDDHVRTRIQQVVYDAVIR